MSNRKENGGLSLTQALLIVSAWVFLAIVLGGVIFILGRAIINVELSPAEFQDIAVNICRDFGGDDESCISYGANLTEHHQADIITCADRANGGGDLRTSKDYYGLLKTCVRDQKLDFNTWSAEQSQ